ncbi:MAG: class III lanthionine synthetase LanKC [candidate division WOR-3 bacterium]
MRSKRHVIKYLYTLLSDKFYEPFENMYSPSNEFLNIIMQILNNKKENWKIIRDGLWFHVFPLNSEIMTQGWKIHISSTINNAERILAKVAKILIDKKIPFKFALDKTILSMMNFKDWQRSASGKFITIYPNENEFKEIIEILYSELKEEEGPYILSDRRYKDCKVLYYRYGGFKRITFVDIMGMKEYMIVSPNGEYIKDERLPYFNLPPWVKDPFPLEDKEPNELALKNGQYLIEKALHFSNTGGVYLAKDRNSNKYVVIKEARPYTCKDNLGNDAVTLLHKEYEILKILKDTNIAPKPIELFQEWEHTFLVMEYIREKNLRELFFSKFHPILKLNFNSRESKEFYKIYKKVFLNFLDALEIIHSKGIILGDISPYNVIVNPKNYKVKFIDFEGAIRKGIDKPFLLFTPGFRKVDRNFFSFNADFYSMGALMFYFLFPINVFSDLRKDLYDNVLKMILKDLGWSKRIYNCINILINSVNENVNKIPYISKYVRKSLVSSNKVVKKAGFITKKLSKERLQKIVEGFGNFILNHIEDEREDRLFPSDPFLYHTNSLSLGFGATGILYALKKCNFDIPKKAFYWIEKKLKGVNEKDYPPGFITGLSGIAWALWELGYEDKSLKIIELTEKSPLKFKNHSLFYGMAGIGLTNLFFYLITSEAKFLERAINYGNKIIEVSKINKKGIFWEYENKVYLGYGYGQSGVSLFLLRLYQVTKEKKYFEYGIKGVFFDLKNGRKIEKDVISFPEAIGDKTLEHYIECGTAGIIKVLLRYKFFNKLKRLIPDICRKYSVFPGILFGISSFIDTLIDVYIFTNDVQYLEMMNRPLTGLIDIYLLSFPDGYAVPGDNLFRISCDYATGIAGVMRTIHRVLTLDEADFTLDQIS